MRTSRPLEGEGKIGVALVFPSEMKRFGLKAAVVTGVVESYRMTIETFRVLGDLTRVRILMTLVGEELCVRDIASGLELTDSAVSHQLRILRNSRLVKFRKDGKNVLYSISDEHVATIFREGLKHVEEL